MKKIIASALVLISVGFIIGCGKSKTENTNQASSPTEATNNGNSNSNPAQEGNNGNVSASFNRNLQDIETLTNSADAVGKNVDTEYDEFENLDTSDDSIEI
ncbi:MAG: hypothetical protein WC497_01565 [Patescibacteria group bacterium]